MIDPGTQPDGEEFEAYNIRRWGSSGWTRSMIRQGSKDGATFRNWKWWPHTLKAHQLILMMEKSYGIETSRSKAALFEALYEEGENISLVDTLCKVANEKLGIEDTDVVRAHLEQDKGAADVKREIDRGRRAYNIKGVPFFIIGEGSAPGGSSSTKKPYGLSGAQPVDTFVELFEEFAVEDSE